MRLLYRSVPFFRHRRVLCHSFFFSSRRRHTRYWRDWSSDVCSSDLSGMVARIHQNFPGQNFTHMWAPMGSFANNPMGINWIGIVFGLGAVQSMGYWTTDFLVVQRVLSAKDIRSAKMAPILGSFFKMAVPLIVILPGLLGLAVLPMHLVPNAPHLAPGQHSYNEVLPLMLARYCGPGLLGLGITALVAGFMAGMAGNVGAFATVWTYEIYRPFLS